MQSLATPDVEVRGTWRSILRRYTGGKLTYASDKLVAISGLAQLLARAKEEEYVAGMWKRDVFRDLLWHSRDDQWKENHTLQRLDNKCPTFSWASVGQSIIFHSGNPEDTHLEAKSPVVESNTAGQAPEHRLRITTQLTEVVLLPPSYSKTGQPRLMLASGVSTLAQRAWEETSVPLDVISRLAEPVRFDRTLDKKPDQDRDTSQYGPFAYDWTPDIPLDGSIVRAWYMCLARQDGYEPPGALGLIVVPVDEARSAWRRIGFLWHSGFYGSWNNMAYPQFRFTVQNSVNDEIDWEETAKLRAPNPFLLDPGEDCVEIVLV